MNLYLTVKWIHVLSSVLMVGTGFGSAYFLFFVNRSRDIATQAHVSRLVVRADLWFTTPTIFIQPISGIILADLAGFPLSSGWIMWTLVLFFFAGACWLPVVWLQLKMAAIANNCLTKGTALPGIYWTYARRWELLGYPAFIAMLVIFYLMVAKPPL